MLVLTNDGPEGGSESILVNVDGKSQSALYRVES
jgi:hypothetical protein